MQKIKTIRSTLLKKRPVSANDIDFNGQVVSVPKDTEIEIERWECAHNNHVLVIVTGDHAGAWFVDLNDIAGPWKYRTGDSIHVNGTQYKVKTVTPRAVELGSNENQSLWATIEELEASLV